MSDVSPLFKKPTYPINHFLFDYLERFDRISKVAISYDDLLRFSGSINVYDKDEKDTLWARVFYSEYERNEIDLNLKKIYSLLHSDGNLDIIKFLNVDAIDYCTFGNSKPFRIKVRNVLNDNYVHFYIKKADASRIYGLELEHILSPDKINFLVYQDTLIEEHIPGIPGDIFVADHLHIDAGRRGKPAAVERGFGFGDQDGRIRPPPEPLLLTWQPQVRWRVGCLPTDWPR